MPFEDPCPSCGSPKPNLHPAVQYEGEVQICPDPYHERVTGENTLEKIAGLRAQKEREAST